MARLTRATITLRRSLAADAETQRAMLDRMARIVSADDGATDDPDHIIAEGLANGIGVNYSIEAYGNALAAKVRTMKKRLDAIEGGQ